MPGIEAETMKLSESNDASHEEKHDIITPAELNKSDVKPLVVSTDEMKETPLPSPMMESANSLPKPSLEEWFQDVYSGENTPNLTPTAQAHKHKKRHHKHKAKSEALESQKEEGYSAWALTATGLIGAAVGAGLLGLFGGTANTNANASSPDAAPVNTPKL